MIWQGKPGVRHFGGVAPGFQVKFDLSAVQVLSTSEPVAVSRNID